MPQRQNREIITSVSAGHIILTLERERAYIYSVAWSHDLLTELPHAPCGLVLWNQVVHILLHLEYKCEAYFSTIFFIRVDHGCFKLTF